MDGTSLAIIIPSVISAALALIALYRTVVSANTSIKVDDATLIRSNLIPTTEWLRREKELNDRLDRMELRIDEQRDAYEKRLVEKDKTIAELTEKVADLTKRTDEQDKIIEDLQKQITHNNV